MNKLKSHLIRLTQSTHSNYSSSKLLGSTHLYSFPLKTKYRRVSQPGYSRYNYDDLGDTTNSFPNSRLTHKTNAEELINAVPVIEVDDNVAMCYGVSDFGWGHPVEYIQLNTRRPEKPVRCKYCGLRYVRKAHH